MLQKIMSYGFVAFLFVVAAALFLHPRLQAEQSTIRVLNQAELERMKWVGDSLAEMSNIKSGMTRADLLKVFEMDGGFGTRESRRYIYRGCPYFKVDVKFKPAVSLQGNADRLDNPSDKIVSISKPYIEQMYID